jgi:hypothetical protein
MWLTRNPERGTSMGLRYTGTRHRIASVDSIRALKMREGFGLTWPNLTIHIQATGRCRL